MSRDNGCVASVWITVTVGRWYTNKLTTSSADWVGWWLVLLIKSRRSTCGILHRQVAWLSQPSSSLAGRPALTIKPCSPHGDTATAETSAKLQRPVRSRRVTLVCHWRPPRRTASLWNESAAAHHATPACASWFKQCINSSFTAQSTSARTWRVGFKDWYRNNVNAYRFVCC